MLSLQLPYQNLFLVLFSWTKQSATSLIVGANVASSFFASRLSVTSITKKTKYQPRAHTDKEAWAQVPCPPKRTNRKTILRPSLCMFEFLGTFHHLSI